MLEPSEILAAKILIVDDQAANISLLTRMLLGIGYQDLYSCSDPFKVVELHQQHQFDLILLDLQMPGMDGFAVMQALQELALDAYLPVLVITAQPEQKVRALQAGAKDFVSKPFDLVEVQTRIRNMIEVRLLYRRLEEHNQSLEQAVKERTAQLKQSEERFKSFTKLSSDWYWEQDANGEYISLSGPVFDMLGIQAAEGENLSSAFKRRWNADEYEALHANIQARQPFLNFVYSRYAQDGSHQLLQVSGEPVFDEGGGFAGYRGIGMELSDRRRPNEESQGLRLIIDSIQEPVLLIDPQTNLLIDANKRACQLLGFKHRECKSKHMDELGLGDQGTLNGIFFQLHNGVGERKTRTSIKDGNDQSVSYNLRWNAVRSAQHQWVTLLMNEATTLTVFDGLD